LRAWGIAMTAAYVVLADGVWQTRTVHTESRGYAPTEAWSVGHLLAHAVISVARLLGSMPRPPPYTRAQVTPWQWLVFPYHDRQ
jgi:hypothetical protein